MKKNRILTAVLAGALSLSLAAPALGVEWPVTINPGSSGGSSVGSVGRQPTTEEINRNGNTTFGIVHATTSVVTNATYEVPLYVTMVRQENAVDLIEPEEYFIRNTGTIGIKVTGVGVTRTSANSYFFTTERNLDRNHGYRALYMSIGGAVVPGLDGNQAKDQTQRNIALADTQEKALQIENSGNVFYTVQGDTRGHYVITPGSTLKIPLEGRVANYYRQQVEAQINSYGIAQFKVKYTITPETLAGVVGVPYVGDDATQANLNSGEYDFGA